MSKFQCSKVSFSFFFKFSLSFCYPFIGTMKNFALRSSDFNLINFLDFFSLPRTSKGRSETVCRLERKRTTLRGYENIALDVVFDHSFSQSIRKCVAFPSSKMTRLTTMFPQLPFPYTTFYNSSQFFTLPEIKYFKTPYRILCMWNYSCS